MDPISAIGFISSVLGIVDIISKGVKSLSDLRSQYNIIDLKVTLLIGQLSTLSAALSQIATILDNNPAQDGRLVHDLSISLSCIEAVIMILDEWLSHLVRNSDTGLNLWGKVGFLWEETEMKEYLSLLDHQVNALNLFLTALQCSNNLDQRRMLERPECCELLSRIKDDTSSLLWLRDSESVGTRRSGGSGSQNLETVNTMFAFDSEIFSSKVYRMATRSNMIRGMSVDTQDTQTIRVTDSDSVTDTIRPLSRISEVGPPLNTPTRLAVTITTRESVRSFRRQSTTASIASRRSWRRSLAWPIPKQRITWQSPQVNIDDSATKVLVLGIEKAGKSTLIKSLNAVYREYDLEWRLEHSHAIRNSLQEFLDRLAYLLEPECNFSLEDSFTSMRLVRERLEEIDPNLCGSGPIIAGFPEHFLTSAKRILDADFIPTVEDILWHYSKSCGISASEHTIDGTTYRFHDVPGSRAQGRTKWRHVCQGTNTVVYMFDVSSYDGVVPSWEGYTNSMHESYDFWAQLVNSPSFATANFVVMLTKVDMITEERLEASPFERCSTAQDFTGRPESRRDILDHITAKLKASIRDVQSAQRSIVFCLGGSIQDSTTDMAMHAISAIKYAALRRQVDTSSPYGPSPPINNLLPKGETPGNLGYRKRFSFQGWQ